jgi:NO-binding membrane sensor protein with MHYT domain
MNVTTSYLHIRMLKQTFVQKDRRSKQIVLLMVGIDHLGIFCTHFAQLLAGSIQPGIGSKTFAPLMVGIDQLGILYMNLFHMKTGSDQQRIL